MRSRVIFRAGSVAAASVFVIAAFGFHANSAHVGSSPISSVSQDFLMLPQAATTGLDRPVAAKAEVREIETLTDWEFTLRERPAKCRFVSFQ